MRATLLLPLLCSCYPDAQKIREQGNVMPGMGGSGTSGGAGGQGGNTAGTGGGGGRAGADAGADPMDAPGGAGGAPVDAGRDGAPVDAPTADASIMDTRRDEPVAPDAAIIVRHCDEWSRNYCARLEICDRSLMLINFGTKERCEQRYKLHCDALDLPGTTWPTKGCAEAYQSILCSNFNANTIPPACAAPGARQSKEMCAEESQCAGRRCAVPAGQRCGECATRSQMDEFCVNDDSCERAFVCFKNRCASPGGVNAPCGTDIAPCQPLLSCIAGKCTRPGAENSPCAKPEDCDQIAGFGCNLRVAQCRTYTVPATDTCRPNMNGTFEVCRASGFCNSLNGTCVPAAADGAACSDERGPYCMFPARCLAAVCRLPVFKGLCQ